MNSHPQQLFNYEVVVSGADSPFMSNAVDPSVFHSIEEALAHIEEGKLVIVVDDEDRENEGDFVGAADAVTAEQVNFMATHGRGLICAPIVQERAEELNLELMVEENTAPHDTHFTVSVDYNHGTSTGISAEDRAATIRALAHPGVSPRDFARPGHVFPLRAMEGGVLRRPGHTEAAVDLARLAGRRPAGVLVEIMNDDGTMARVPDLIEIAERFEMPLVSIKDLIDYRIRREPLVERSVTVELPTQFGTFDLVAYQETLTGKEHLALTKGEWNDEKPVLVRLHSQCITGDVFASLRCDCGDQLALAMQAVEREGRGIILYMRQEGRGIGLINKLKAYKLQQEEGMDTVEANEALGFQMDQREYGISYQILRDLGVDRLRLLTNNPQKSEALASCGLEVVERVPIEVTPNDVNENYLRTKRDRMGHLILEDDQLES
jgi:3,4-dihydroxy 2-butanone 4-phosphate synthase/GTP cyclohydrolase II